MEDLISKKSKISAQVNEKERNQYNSETEEIYLGTQLQYDGTAQKIKKRF